MTASCTIQSPSVLGCLVTMWSRQLALYASLAVLSALRSHAGTVTSGGLRIIENSGECETVPDVRQASGYADIDANNSM